MLHQTLDYNIENFRGFTNPEIINEFTLEMFNSELLRISSLEKPLRDEIATVLYRFTKQYFCDEFREKIETSPEFELTND
jgi:hypothetical protein